ncbi:hypothetical protein K443DRAFT_135694 [Laccaria amethystina LaAM-08-1]|uniref:Chromo domain-containing protein n=1 Tax=Laccaria amethystina LaAM-08-1 TaxID=1095629 RepID=A0A0C9X0Z9_9AGAR|nr:hypothetical protein K443DRAFT_135694 [Laccaria amethystina LaAM-08-1]
MEHINLNVYRLRLPNSYLMHLEYEVEAILGDKLSGKKKGNRRMFRVQWAGFGPESDSWVSEADLRNSLELKREYLTKLGLD